MTTKQPTVFLTPDQVAFFHREGYLSIPSLTSPDELKWLREVYDRIFAQRAGREEGMQFDLAGTDEEGKEAVMPQILNPSKYAPELNESQLLVNTAAVLSQLLGEAVVAGFGHAIYKPPRISPQTPWHQDASYWGGEWVHRSVSVWVPLQEATLENGCMQFVPHSHETTEVFQHRSVNNDPRIHALELTPEEMWRVKNPVACPLPPGGATFHGGYMLHYTGPNRSDVPRRAIILGGGLPGTKRDKPQRFPWIEEKKTLRSERAAQAAAKKTPVQKV